MNRVVKNSRGRKPSTTVGWRQRSRIRSELNRRIFRSLQTADVGNPVEDIEQQTYLSESSITSIMDTTDDEIANANQNTPHCPLLAPAIYELPPVDTQSNSSQESTANYYRSSVTDDDFNSSDEERKNSITEVPAEINFREQLASCFVDNNLSFTCGDGILNLLRSHKCFAHLPKSTKTLLGTPRNTVALSDVAPGKYLHLGFKVAIYSMLDGVPPDEIPSFLEIDFSTDGANIDNSGNNDIWPIQCRIANIKGSITEVIGIYKGDTKPEDPIGFFRAFVDEANEVIHYGGIELHGKRISIRFRAFIADAPARALILNHMGHMSSNPCSKCHVAGEYWERRMTLRGTGHKPRTDEEYSTQSDNDHHKEGDTALSFLPIGLVSQVPFEYMHLILLGVMKRLFSAWISGKFSMRSKLSGHQIDLFSNRIDHLKQYCPQEFARYPRNIGKYSRYKATEHRLFLLYIGPVILHGIVPDEIYQHFLLLHASIRILASICSSEEHFIYAKSALEIFVRQCEPLYGRSFISYNVHGLLHVADDVKLLGLLDSYSAFPYENNMKIFRKYCKKPHLHLQQIARRRAERAQRTGLRDRETCRKTEALDEHSEGPLPTCTSSSEFEQYRRVKSAKFTLNLKKQDCCCILIDSSVCIVRNIVVRNSEIMLVVNKFRVVDNFYDVAMPSKSVGYYACSALQNENCLVKYADVIKKGFLMDSWPLHPCCSADTAISENRKYVVAAMTCEINY